MSESKVGSFLGWCAPEVGEALRRASGRADLDRPDLLAALLDDEAGTASQALERIGVDRAALLTALEPLTSKETGPMVIGHHVMTTVDFAAAEAARAGTKQITGGHLLAALAWGLRAGHWFKRHPEMTAWRVLAGWRDGTVTLWDLEHKRGPLVLTPGSAVECVTASADWHQIACGCGDGTMHLFHLQHDFHASFEPPPDGMVRAIDWSPVAPILLSGGDDGIARLWNTENGEPLHELHGHVGPIRTVVFDPKGNYAYTGGDDATVRVWEVETGNMCDTFEGHAAPVRRVAFPQPHLPLVSSAEDDEAILWRTPPERHPVPTDPLEPVLLQFGISAATVRAAL